MIYTELVLVIMGISLIFYVLLGGADFGAGIIELFVGDRANHTISKAIAPVWEANHIWLIIALVILFNGFPEAYVIFSTALHIPILIVLVGIIFRGAAFTFRHYDAYKDSSQQWYSALFRYSSILTVLFLGITVAAFFSGTIPPKLEGSFFSYYIAPWANGFCFSIGIFLTVLSAYIAAIFLLGEVETTEGYEILHQFSKRLFIAAFISGCLIFVTSYYQQLDFHRLFFSQPLSIGCGIIASLLVPYIFKLIQDKKIWPMRIWVGAQILLILLGWLLVQWPDLIRFSDGSSLSSYDASAPELTMKILFGALVFGVCTIFPALYYLFRVFKVDRKTA